MGAFRNRGDNLKLNMDSLVSLSNLLRKDYFDEKEFRKLIKTKGMKGFFEHQRAIEENVSIKEELERVIYEIDYEDKYGFYIAKNNLKELENNIKYIIEHENYIVDKAIGDAYKIIPKHVGVRGKIFLFLGGNDGGFTVARKNIYINYGKYIDDIEEFIKILSHELYHSRNIPIQSRIMFFMKANLKKYGEIYGIIGKIVEEGVASLVQHGPTLKVDDPVDTLNSRDLILIKDEFKLLNEILIDIKVGRHYHKKLKELNFYAIGYYIVCTIYNAEGVFTLDNWTVNLNYERIIKRYIEICNANNVSTGFNEDIENLIIK